MSFHFEPVRVPQAEATYLRNGWWRSDRTFVDDFYEVADREPDRIAVVGARPTEGVEVMLTYEQLRDKVRRLAGELRAHGVVPGDVVSFQLPNWWQFDVIVLAVGQVGAIANPILPIHRDREVRHVLRTVGSRIVLAAGGSGKHSLVDLYERIAGDVDVPVVFVDPDGDVSLGGSGHTSDESGDASAVVDPDSIAQIQFTSGTTGAPKGVVHSFNTLYAAYRSTMVAALLTKDDVVFAPSTMAHQTAFLGGCVMPLAEGMTTVHADAWAASSVLELIERHGVTFASGATPFMTDLCEAQSEARRDVSSLRAFKSGGAAVALEVRDRVRDVLGAEVLMAWGMTENGVCTMATPGSSANQGDGLPLPWVSLKVTDEAGSPVPDGQPGRLWVRSASQCLGYFPQADLYQASLDAQGWFDTSDLALIDGQGALHVKGRIKDLVIRGGENIPVVEVEDALASHRAIKEVAVVGVPDERLGERACAVVALYADQTFDLADLRQHLAGIGMAKQYWPEFVEIVDQFPRTTSGKIQKAEVKSAVIERLRPNRTQTEPHRAG